MARDGVNPHYFIIKLQEAAGIDKYIAPDHRGTPNIERNGDVTFDTDGMSPLLRHMLEEAIVKTGFKAPVRMKVKHGGESVGEIVIPADQMSRETLQNVDQVAAKAKSDRESIDSHDVVDKLEQLTGLAFGKYPQALVAKDPIFEESASTRYPADTNHEQKGEILRALREMGAIKEQWVSLGGKKTSIVVTSVDGAKLDEAVAMGTSELVDTFIPKTGASSWGAGEKGQSGPIDLVI